MNEHKKTNTASVDLAESPTRACSWAFKVLEMTKFYPHPSQTCKLSLSILPVNFSILLCETKRQMSRKFPKTRQWHCTLSCSMPACKFQWLNLQTIFQKKKNNKHFTAFPDELVRTVSRCTVRVHVQWAGKCFRAVCCLRSLLTSSCDHSFHIRGSFTASLTLNKTAYRQISDSELNCFSIFTQRASTIICCFTSSRCDVSMTCSGFFFFKGKSALSEMCQSCSECKNSVKERSALD